MVPLPRVFLAQLPTPCHPLPGYGADLWIKRDDLTGLALGGNKARKLEYLIADALAKGAKAIVTCGAAQSNFVRMASAACAIHSLEFHAIVMDHPYEDEPAVGARPWTGGNELLSELFGAHMIRLPDDTWDALYQAMDDHVDHLRSLLGGQVVVWPVGGSGPLGAFAFREAAQEIGENFHFIVFASASGSTHVGLAHAFRGSATQVLGIAVDPEPDLPLDFGKISVELGRLTGDQPLSAEEFRFDLRFVGPGYGVPSGGGEMWRREVARRSGILLDPIYTGKAFHGLMEMVRDKEIGGRILFWHTGGVPAIFAT